MSDPSLTIRPLNTDDADEISRLIINNLTLVNIHDYGEHAIKELIRFYTPDWIRKYAQQQEIFVAQDISGIIGTISLDQKRVRNVFIRIDHHQQGTGTLLMMFVEEIARQKNNTGEYVKYPDKIHLFLESNIAATGFYKKLGYQFVEEKSELIGEAQIKVVLMEKWLSP